jgi:tetratricopeptide (TPR) repeat protein
MNRDGEKLVQRAENLYAAGMTDEAIRILDDLIREVSGHSDKFGLLYYQMMWLLDKGAVSHARNKLNEMRAEMSYLNGSVAQDSDLDDLAANLAVIERFAEARLLMKEGADRLALGVLEDLISRYPKQLSLQKFRELNGEAEMHRGILLANADRWLEAGVFLERAIPPRNFGPILDFYLGQYYYTIRDYRRAIKSLQKSMTPEMPPNWRSRLHHLLGLAEYHLSHIDEAKKQFELSVQDADTEYIRRNDIWAWLERISSELGQNTEAEKYRKIKEEAQKI